MQKASDNRRRLFMLCPASQSESFIKKQSGDNVFVLTALGVVFDFRQLTYVEALVGFLERESIDEVYVVQDVACPFIKSVMHKEQGFSTHAEDVLLDLLIENYSDIMQSTSRGDQKIRLARYNIERQISEILANELLLQAIKQHNIILRGLISSKAEDWLKKVNLKLKETYP